ncbi:hypothetical protein [Thomasclavelia sp.]
MKFKINENCSRDNIAYGYKQVNGKLKINLNEAEKVKFLFSKYIEYENHPPLELIKNEITSALEKKEWLPYEEAKQRISSEAKKLYILKELRNL